MATPSLRLAARARASVLALAALVVGTACLNGAHAPDGPPKGKLSLTVEPEARDATGPFAVVFGAPKGPTVDPPEISLVFNRPMVPLELAGNEPPAPVKLTPEVKGRWQWIGTNALVFVPEVRLPRATELRVEVPKGTKSLGGDTLDRPYVLEFSTARPRVVRMDTNDDRYRLPADATFTVWTNQPVDVAEIGRAVTLSAGNEGTLVPLDVKQRDADNPQVFVLTPRKKLPLGRDLHLHVAEDLRGKEGPLTAGEVGSFDAATYGPFAVTEVGCYADAPQGKCSFDGGVSIRLTNPVPLAALKKAVRVEPRVDLRWPSWMDEDEETSDLYVYGAFKPGRRYTVTIAAAGLKDVFEQPLQGDFSKALEFGDVWPSAEIGVSGTYVEPGATTELPVWVVNAQDAELAVDPLSEEDVVSLEGERRSLSRPFEALLHSSGVQTRKIGPASTVNTAARHAIKIADVLGKGGRGPMEIGVRYTHRPGTRHAHLTDETRRIQVTDLSISAKISPEGSLVWVTRLSTGAPVAGADVTIRSVEGQVPGQHLTDKDGFVRFPKSEFQPRQPYEEPSVIIVKSGADWAYRPVRDMLDGWRYGASFQWDEESAFGLVFTDAGIYRPGDAVRIKGIVREPLPKGVRTPAGRTIKLRVESSDDQTIADIERRLSPYGTFDAEVKVPPTGRLGTYRVWTDLVDAEGGTDASASFEVAEYRAAEFKVTAETDKPSYVRGDSVACTARGDYLYGAPMAKSEARVTLTRKSTGIRPPGADDFSVDDFVYSYDLPDTSPDDTTLQSATATLDDRGSTVVKADLTMPAQRGPELVMCEAEITDISRQALSGGTTAIVHPGEFYVALKGGDQTFLSTADTVHPQVLAIDPKGAKVPGKKVDIALIRRTWAVARQKTGGGGIHRVSTPVDKVAASCSVTTAAAPVSCALKPTQPGYYILRATAQDARKNPLAASTSVYVTGEGTSGWRDADDNRLDLVTDKKSYAVGQTARVLVKSPFPSAEAWITVERAGVYTSTKQTLKGSMPSISIPVTADLRPNAFVTVLLVRGRSKAPPADPKGADVGAPSFRFGAVEIPIDPEARRLSVKLTPDATDKRPGQDIQVAAEVRDSKGKPARAEVTLYAVDEGVLSLIGYETPDPLVAMSEPRPLRVGTLETREALARTFNPFAALGLDKGKDGGDGAAARSPSFRRDFRTSAYFHPSLVTDDQGRVEARFKLPESLTTYRIMAVVAAEDDRFGYAQSHVTTSRPLMARPALPRFLRAGDTIDAGVVVTAKGIAKSAVDVELAADGVAVQGPTKKTVDLEPGQSVEVRFAMASKRVGDARLRFTAKGGGEEDRVEVTRRIQPPISLEAAALYGDTTSQAVEALGDMSAIRDDVGGLSIAASSTALIGLDAGVEHLVEYPYGCTEQLTSRLVPLLPLRDLAKDYGFALPKNVDAVVLEAVAKILAHQKGDGGFGFWAESERSSPWVSAYALWGLTFAERRGVAIPKHALESATTYLQKAIEEIANDPWERAAIPFILDVLAERGQPDVARMGTWYEARKQLPLFAQAQLLHAMVLGKADRKATDTLATEIEGSLRLDGPAARVVSNHGNSYATLLDSDTRSTALVLRGLVAAKPNHPLASKLVMGLLGDRKGGTWRNTQETAWSLLAIDDYRRKQEKAVPNFVAHLFLGQTEVGSHRFEGRSLTQASTTIPARQIVTAGGSPLGFRVDGDGKLFYEARLRYAKKEMPKKPIDRGFFVTKTLRPVKPESLAEALGKTGDPGTLSFTGGDLVLADVTVVTTTPRTYVVVDDPLPAGFEAIDARLATTGSSVDLDQQDGGGDFDEDDVAMERAYFSSWYVREVRDDRVVFFIDAMAPGMYRYRYLARATTHGTFITPPARAEEMYAPEVFGRTAASTITVLPK